MLVGHVVVRATSLNLQNCCACGASLVVEMSVHMTVVACSRRVSLVVEMFVRMLHHCGMPMDDVDLIHGNGKVVGEILKSAQVRSTLFTGSAKVAETLAKELSGKVCCSSTIKSPLTFKEMFKNWGNKCR